MPDAQKILWPQLAPCRNLKFVLYGETAIALHLGHRCSVDFDFFSPVPLGAKQEKQLLKFLPFLKDADLLQKEENTRSYRTSDGVKLSFFGKITFGRIAFPSLTSDEALEVASLEELMATKLAVITQLVGSKDYRDIAAMLMNGVSLEKGLTDALALYGKQFSPSESLKALTYFHGGDLEVLSQRDRNVLLEAVCWVEM